MQWLIRGNSYSKNLKFRALVLGVLVSLGVSGDLEAQVLEGVSAGDRFGSAVALAGDVNNDGFTDLLVGIPNRNAAGQNAGEVHLYFGRENVFPSTPDLVILGQVSGDEFGFAVSSAGDVNQDGYDDFLVGAPGHNTNGLDSGRVYLFLGGSSPNGTADKIWDGDIANAHFGASLAGGFHFNGDNRSDFAVGAPGHNGTGLRAGQVKIFLGSASGLATEAFVLNGDQANWALGHSLDPAGDLDKDGFDDLVAGAPQPFDLNSGRAVVWFGQSSSMGTPDRLVFSGEVGTDLFGWDVSGTGDLNGDGVDDLLVGAPAQGADRGAVYIFRGGTNMNTDSDWKATGGNGGDRLGVALDGGYDINADGKPDFAVGAPGANSLGSDAGEVRIYHGRTNPTTGADSIWIPDAPVKTFEAGDEFGSSVRFLGSLNGHEGAEIVAGAPAGNASSGTKAGYVNIFTHPTEIVPVRLLVFEARYVDAGVKLNWELADAGGVLGFRLEVDERGTTRNLHEGWLAPSVRSFVDSDTRTTEGSYRLLALDRLGDVSLLGEIPISGGGVVLGLSAPDQNPFRDQVQLRLSIPGGAVEVFVSDVRGRQVRKLLEGTFSPGFRNITWDGRDELGLRVPPGMYVVWSRAGGKTASTKVVHLPY